MGYGIHLFFDFFRIAEEIILYEIQIIVKLKYIRYGSRQIEMYDFVVRNVF